MLVTPKNLHLLVPGTKLRMTRDSVDTPERKDDILIIIGKKEKWFQFDTSRKMSKKAMEFSNDSRFVSDGYLEIINKETEIILW